MKRDMADEMKIHSSRPATIIDVAREAGVSFKTVSRVLNGEKNVRDITRHKVRSAVKKLGYRANHHARNLRAKKSGMIALLFSNPSRNYLGEVHWGALQRCQAEGYNLISEEWSGDGKTLLALSAGTDIAGVVLTPPLTENMDLIKLLEVRAIPYVRISASEHRATCGSVGIDDRAAAREMTEHLIRLGHQRIGFIKGADAHYQAQNRLEGYKDALLHHDLRTDEDLITPGTFAFVSGIEAADTLLNLEAPPTAIFAANDDMAAGALAVAYRRRISIPEDLSIVGFDDTPLASTISPALTTIYQPSKEMASEAVGLLLRRLKNPDKHSEPLLLKYRLVVRESAAAPKA